MPIQGELPIGMRFRPSDFELAHYFLKHKALNLPMKTRTIPEECLDIFYRHPRDLPGYGEDDHLYFYNRKLAEQVPKKSYNLWKPTGEQTDVLDPNNNGELVGIKRSYSFIDNEESSDSDNLSEGEENPKYNWYMDEISLPKTIVDTDWVVCHIFCEDITHEFGNLSLVESESDLRDGDEDVEEDAENVKEKDENVSPPPSATP